MYNNNGNLQQNSHHQSHGLTNNLKSIFDNKLPLNSTGRSVLLNNNNEKVKF